MAEPRAELVKTILVRPKEADWRTFGHYHFWGIRAGIFMRRNKNPLTFPLNGFEQYREPPPRPMPGALARLALAAGAI